MLKKDENNTVTGKIAVVGDKDSYEDLGFAVKKGNSELLQKISAHLKEAQKALGALEAITAKAAAIEDMPTAARAYHDEVMPAMTALRTPVDAMEVLVDKKDWPMPAYSDLIFEV